MTQRGHNLDGRLLKTASQHTIVLAGLSQRQDYLYVGLIRHRTFRDDEHSYLCVSEAI